MSARTTVRAARRGRTLAALAALLVATALLAACGSSDSGSDGAGSGAGTDDATTTTAAGGEPVDLAGTSWLLVSFAGADGTATDAAAAATLNLAADGKAFGGTGCNSFTATYTVDGDSISFELGAMTQMACADEAVNAQEAAVTAQLAAATTFTATAEQLVLSGDDGDLLTYAAADTSVEGAWTITGLNNGKGAVTSDATVNTLTATFADGEFSGFGGCNQLFGTYTTEGDDGIAIGPVGGTMMACEGDAGTVEAQYTAALGAVATYQVDGDTLTMRDADGATQITAARATEESVPAGE